MSNFTALNIESDSDTDDEVDDTKEIQIEEALKLYQTALKYHSEGPQSFDKAADAYRALFVSEIFKYPESFSELRRLELYGERTETETVWPEDFEAGPVQLVNTSDGAPNTLPQILHLSYKNHGQFMLELLRFRLKEHLANVQEQGTWETSNYVANTAKSSLSCFTEALDKDDTDLDLWTRTSAVANLVGTERIARYCLEAVLDGDVEGLNNVFGLPGVEEGLALEQLRELVKQLYDDLAFLQAPLVNAKLTKLSPIVKKRLNPLPFLPSKVLTNTVASDWSLQGRKPVRVCITPIQPTWAAVGEAILQHFCSEQGGFNDIGPGHGITITLPWEPKHASMPLQTSVDAGSIEPVLEEPRPENGDLGKEIEHGDLAAPAATDGDVEMQEVSTVDPEQRDEGAEAVAQPESFTLPTRKRSTDSAGLPETAEGVRIRSKRIRARESLVDGAEISAADLDRQVEDQLQLSIHADHWMFETVGAILAKLHVHSLGSSQSLRNLFSEKESGANVDGDPNLSTAINDLHSLLRNCAPETAAILLNGEMVDRLGGTPGEAGLNAFLGYAKPSGSQSSSKPILAGDEGLYQWIDSVNTTWMHIKEVAFAWIECLLAAGKFPYAIAHADPQPSYTKHQWPGKLKEMVVQMAVHFDEYIFQRMLDKVGAIDAAVLHAAITKEEYHISDFDASAIEMVQTLFELHLDVCALIKHPGSGVDHAIQTLQKDRLERWASLARDAINLRPDHNQGETPDQLTLRHIWASAFHVSIMEGVPQEHVIFCMMDLRALFTMLGDLFIQLQNNAIMPELSATAADRELSRIRMKDFFLQVFDQNRRDPVAVIEGLEPILEPTIAGDRDMYEEDTDSSQAESTLSSRGAGQSSTPYTDTGSGDVSPSREMRHFLETGNISLRLSLWQRLREAYEAIDYPPKVVSCYLRSIEILMSESSSSSYRGASKEQRYFMLSKGLRLADEFLTNIMVIAKTNPHFLECIDDAHLHTSTDALAKLIRLVHTANLYMDSIRVGQVAPPMFEGRPKPSFSLITTKLQDMQVRAWMLQYMLLKEGMTQHSEVFRSSAEDRFDYLRTVHYTTGIRGNCTALNKTFLKFLRDEFLLLMEMDYCDAELSQVLYDLYGIRCSPNLADFIDHGCGPNFEPLDRKTALKLLDFIMAQAQKIDLKDLSKTELKATIDKVHGALGRSKNSDVLTLNRRLYSMQMKSPIHPMDLYRCLQGVGAIAAKSIPPKQAPAASKGWYFLMGNIALTRFRQQKKMRQGAGPTEDLNIAVAFFAQDLEYTMDRWETWYRLAQAHDLQLDECVSWTAEKVNNNSHEVIQFQRCAIQCYTMAAACAIREADTSPEMTKKVAELYADFGARMYSSSRQPFSMQAFGVRESEETWYSEQFGQKLYKGSPFIPLQLHTAWKYASTLFRRAIARSADQWMSHYMLGKCLWKMYTANETISGRPEMQEILDCFVRAIEMLPERRDNRRDREPVLEPHYKLVSIVHKLVQRRDLAPHEASDILQASSYAHKVPPSTELDTWEPYVLQLLKVLRAADKSGWHHRMTARAAHVIYDDCPNEITAAMGAKHELTQQIFTKTMTIQVWRPEYERPGRHFVYTTRYLRFFVRLLVQLGDRTSLEALAKRVRRRNHDFYDHSKLWQELCVAYLKLLRQYGRVPEGHEDTVFKSLSHEEFAERSARLEAWCQQPNQESYLLDVLRDVIELKKVNNNLMKATLIDDLIGDTYAKLYEQVTPNLGPLPPKPTSPADTPVPEPSKSNMMSLNNLMNVDGAADAQPLGAPFSWQTTYDQLPKPRNKGVGRRELQRKAEAAVTKPIVPPTPARPQAQTSGAGSHPEVVIPVRHPEQLGTVLGGVESSAPGSVLSSADNESGSELSELEEEEEDEEEDPQEIVVRPLFPGLAAAQATAGSATASHDPSGTATPADVNEGDADGDAVHED